MKIIQTLSERIEEEIGDAKWYIKRAFACKDEYPDVSRTYYNLAVQELEHSSMLHDAVTDAIKKYKDENGDPPEGMLALYNYLHKKEIKDYDKVKRMVDEYKNS